MDPFWKALFFCAILAPGTGGAEHAVAGDACGKNGIGFTKGHKPEIEIPKEAHIFNLMAFGVLQGLENEVLRDGYIISLEKRTSKDRGSNANHHRPYLKTYEELVGTDALSLRTAARRDKFIGYAFDDPKLQVVTHVTRFEGEKSCGLYNGYGSTTLPLCAGGRQRETTLFQDGIDVLEDEFLQDLSTRLASGQFTHVFFISMGWHNDQRVSMCRYRTITDMIGKEMESQNRPFNPMIVGMTWSSSWFAASQSSLIESIGHIGSIFNKATDSDEAGMLYGNIILNRVIPIANSRNLPVVVVGHSMGARLAGQALFARDLLRQGVAGPPAEVAVFLQPAHSAYRYVAGEGKEGSPYDGVRFLKTRVIVTTSLKDKSNPWGFWSPYLGGKRGLSQAGEHKTTYDIETVGPVNDNSEDWPISYQLPPAGKVGLVNATFVKNHNDILDPEMGRFIAHVMIAAEPAK